MGNHDVIFIVNSVYGVCSLSESRGSKELRIKEVLIRIRARIVHVY